MARRELHECVQEMRRFNRFYSAHQGLLDKGFLESSYSLTECRVLYELGHRDGILASEVAGRLNLDPAYLSRILRRFKKDALIVSKPNKLDRREYLLTITARGRDELDTLEQVSDTAVGALLTPLSSRERGEMLKAMAFIRATLAPVAHDPDPIVLRQHRTGDVGWVVQRHAVLYSEEYGWDGTFEAFVAEIGAQFIRNFDPARERCWIADRGGEPLGSIFLVDGGKGEAKIRMLFVEPAARGLGVGRRLVDECIGFARQAGYGRISLWTNDILVSARHIYEAAGFSIISEEAHHNFGKDLIGQYWGRAL